MKTIEIDQAVEAFYAKHNAIPLFKGYPGKTPFPAVTCLSVNEQVVHGIPGQRVLKEGDLLKVDTACKLNGWCADRAITVPIGTVSPEKAAAAEGRRGDAADRHRPAAQAEVVEPRWPARCSGTSSRPGSAW